MRRESSCGFYARRLPPWRPAVPAPAEEEELFEQDVHAFPEIEFSGIEQQLFIFRNAEPGSPCSGGFPAVRRTGEMRVIHSERSVVEFAFRDAEPETAFPVVASGAENGIGVTAFEPEQKIVPQGTQDTGTVVRRSGRTQQNGNPAVGAAKRRKPSRCGRPDCKQGVRLRMLKRFGRKESMAFPLENDRADGSAAFELPEERRKLFRLLPGAGHRQTEAHSACAPAFLKYHSAASAKPVRASNSGR